MNAHRIVILLSTGVAYNITRSDAETIGKLYENFLEALDRKADTIAFEQDIMPTSNAKKAVVTVRVPHIVAIEMQEITIA